MKTKTFNNLNADDLRELEETGGEPKESTGGSGDDEGFSDVPINRGASF